MENYLRLGMEKGLNLGMENYLQLEMETCVRFGMENYQVWDGKLSQGYINLFKA